MTTDDPNLIHRLAHGDERALAALLERHWAPLVRYAYGLLGDWDVAEDVGQEAYARLWANRERWRESSSAAALLFRVTRNACLDLLKSPRHTARVEGLEALSAPDRPDHQVEAAELGEALATALEALPARRREVYRLARDGGLSYGEIADVTGLSRQTVANHMSLALSDLRAMLRPFLSDSAHEAESTGEGSADTSATGG